MSDDDLYISIDGKTVSGFETYKVTRSIEQFPSSFELTATEKDPFGKTTLFFPFQSCQIKLGNDVVLTGYIDAVAPTITPNSHSISLVGRSKCEDLFDCSAEFPGHPISTTQTVKKIADGSITSDTYFPGATYIGIRKDDGTLVYGYGLPEGTVTTTSVTTSAPATGIAAILPTFNQFNTDLKKLAISLAKPYGIDVVVKTSKPLLNIPLFQVAIGEPAYNIIEYLSRSQNLLVYDDVNGNLVLSEVGSSSHFTGFEMGKNIESISNTLNFDQRFSEIDVLYQAIPDLAASEITQYGKALDSPYIRHRRLIAFADSVPAVVGADYQTWLQRRADWEMTRRQGRSQAVTLVTSSWRDKTGKLWEPNYLVNLVAPQSYLKNALWLIVSVTYSRDLQNGTTATLLLMPPSAFTIEPIVLTPLDAASLPESGTQ